MILATQRTGSNWLMGLLDGCPSITVYDELFLPRALGEDYNGRTDLEFFETYYVRHRRRRSRLTRALWGLRYLGLVYGLRAQTPVVGMKLMYGQLWRNPSVWVYLLFRRVRVVHLVRQNLLDVIVSFETASARQQFHAENGESVSTPAVRLEPETLLASLRTLEFRVRCARRLLRALPVRSLEVTYEELLADPGGLAQVLAFLDVSCEHQKSRAPRFARLNTARKPDLISNYDEVTGVLAGTRFEPML